MKKRRNPNMVSLYLEYILQKSTIIVFSISIILMIVALLIVINPKYDHDAYLLSMESFHLAYFQQAIFIINIFNGIIVTTLTIILILQSVSFDVLFIGRLKRTRLSTSKLIASAIIFLLISIIEYVILFGYPTILFDGYKIEAKYLLAIPILFLSMAFLFSLETILSSLISTIFTPMVVLFISLVISIISANFSVLKDNLSIVLPILDTDGNSIICSSLYVLPVWITLFVLLYVSIYNVKDLKQ